MESSPFLRSSGRFAELLSYLAIGVIGAIGFVISLLRANDPADNDLNGVIFFLVGLGLLLLSVFLLRNFFQKQASRPHRGK
jgi:hypothetical protein